MTRMSKQGERRAMSPHSPRPPAKKTGTKKDNLAQGFKPHANVMMAEAGRFFPKVK